MDSSVVLDLWCLASLFLVAKVRIAYLQYIHSFWVWSEVLHYIMPWCSVGKIVCAAPQRGAES